MGDGWFVGEEDTDAYDWPVQKRNNVDTNKCRELKIESELSSLKFVILHYSNWQNVLKSLQFSVIYLNLNFTNIFFII